MSAQCPTCGAEVKLQGDGTFRATGAAPVDPDEDLDELDPEQRAEVEAARARLDRDKGGVVEDPTPPRKVKVHASASAVTVEVPPPSPVQRAGRAELIAAGLLNGLKGDEEAALQEAYVKGGPVWLHAFDRQFVITLPRGFRRMMVEDVAITDEASALLLGADILKHGVNPGEEDTTPKVEGWPSG